MRSCRLAWRCTILIWYVLVILCATEAAQGKTYTWGNATYVNLAVGEARTWSGWTIELISMDNNTCTVEVNGWSEQLIVARRSLPKVIDGVRVFLADGRTETIAVPSKRKKWAQVSSALESLHWQKLEALDSKGAILGVEHNDEPATALEDLSDIENAKVGETRGFLQLMLRAQDVALGRHTEVVTKTMELNTKLAQVLMDRLTVMEKRYQQLLDAFEEKAEGGDGFESRSEPLIRAMTPHLLKKMNGGKSALDEE